MKLNILERDVTTLYWSEPATAAMFLLSDNLINEWN